VPSLYDILASAFQPTQQPDPYGVLAGALKADPEGASGFADLAGRSREARAAAGAITAPVGALDYMGKTLRGEEDLRDPVTGGFTNEAYGAAGTLAGVGMTGGIGAPVRTAAGEAVLGAGPIRAYHGSPHDFDRFDLSKIGTGEGAQAYGHGLYFAENPRVAEEYRQALASWPTTIRSLLGREVSDDAALTFQRVANEMGDRPRTAASWAQAGSHELRGVPEETLANAVPQYRALERPGRMYEVGIHADPERFLDWDKPLVEQPHVWAPLHDAGVGVPRKPVTQGDLANLREKYGAWGDMQASGLEPLLTRTGGEVAPRSADAAQALREAGIPGIRYLDAGSRGTGTGSSNYVMFDPATIEILRKYGFLGPLIAGAATASMPDEAKAGGATTGLPQPGGIWNLLWGPDGYLTGRPPSAYLTRPPPRADGGPTQTPYTAVPFSAMGDYVLRRDRRTRTPWDISAFDTTTPR
jgi:hypothetical protein